MFVSEGQCFNVSVLVLSNHSKVSVDCILGQNVVAFSGECQVSVVEGENMSTVDDCCMIYKYKTVENLKYLINNRYILLNNFREYKHMHWN